MGCLGHILIRFFTGDTSRNSVHLDFLDYSLSEILPTKAGHLSDRLKILAGQNKILQDRRLVCYQITISFCQIPQDICQTNWNFLQDFCRTEWKFAGFVRQSCSFRKDCDYHKQPESFYAYFTWWAFYLDLNYTKLLVLSTLKHMLA